MKQLPHQPGKMGRMGGAAIIGCAMAGFLLHPSAALAHRVNVFAWVEGDTVHVEAKYPGGRKVKNGLVRVLDSGGRLLLEGRTDPQGGFSFRAPARTDMKIVLDAGLGHRAEWIVKADEFHGRIGNRASEPPAERAPPAAEASRHGEQPGPGSPDARALEIRRIVEQSLDARLAPVLRKLDEIEGDRVTFADVMGGIGYILGLIGVAAYFSSRRKSSG